MIIDAHAHACGIFLNTGSIIETLGKNSVDKVVLVPGELGSARNYSLPDIASKFPNTDIIRYLNIPTKMVILITGIAKQIGEGNAYVHSLVKQLPERIIQFYWVLLSQPGVLDELERHYAEYGFKGIKFHQCWEYFKVDSEPFHNVDEWAGSKGLPIFVHLFSWRQATRLASYIKSHSKTKFIIAHLFGLERYIKAGINSDNIFFEISTPQVVSVPRLKKAIHHFGVEKVLLGSDTPYGKNNVELNIKKIRKLDISDEEKDMILGNNMKKLLGF